MYYAVLLCSAGLFTVLAGIPLPWVHYPTIDFGGFGSLSLRHIGLVGLALQYLTFGIAFIIDRYAIRLMTVKENISLCRNVLHWLSSPLVLLQYSLIAFWAIMKFVVVGKGMARHDMAAKDGLGAVTKAAPEDSKHQGLLDTDPPPPPDIEYDDDLIPVGYATRSRSTSLSMDMAAGRVSDVGTLQKGVEVQVRGSDKPVMCELPEKFRFGEFELDVQDYIRRRAAGAGHV